MDQDLFANLPPEITIDILSRLPILSIMGCKCVRKSWLALLETPDFVKSQLTKAVAGLTLFESLPRLYTVYEFEDGLINLENRCKSVFKFNLPFQNGWIWGSVDGLILQCYHRKQDLTLYICNPITRDYIEIQPPQQSRPRPVALGFGVSKISGQHKVVSVFVDYNYSKCNCFVYTLGTGGWKEIAPPADNLNGCRIDGVFLNGNLHWLVSDLRDTLQPWISCFDLEDEKFRSFSSPLMAGSNTRAVVLCASGDSLCLCGKKSDVFDIWLMKEYGAEKYWTKQFVIKISDFDHYCYEVIYPIQVSKDGEILLAWKLKNFIFSYSEENQNVRRINDKFESCADIVPFLLTPSLLSLRSFGRENVRSF